MELIDGSYELDINPKKVCRLCLSQPVNLQNIFSNSIVDGCIISVPDMLAFTVDITVNQIIIFKFFLHLICSIHLLCVFLFLFCVGFYR